MMETMNDDIDAASLREALALLGDWEDEFSSLFASTTLSPFVPVVLGDEVAASPKAKQHPVKRPRDASSPNEYRLKRDARRTALTRLQTEANDLQHVLEKEQARRAASSRNTSALQQECEEMALRQKRQRLSAETENVLLREDVSTHRALSRRIVKLTQKAAAIGELLGDTSTSLTAKYDGPVIPIPQHVRYLDCRMDEARGILSSGMFEENCDRDFHQVRFRDLGFDGLQNEFAISWVVPFGVDAVAGVFWSLLAGSYHRGRTTNHELMHSAPDLLITSFASSPRTHGHGQPNCNHGQAIVGVTHGQTAVRRYNDDDNRSGGSRFLILRIRATIFHDDGTRKGDMSTDTWLQIEPLTTTKATVTTQQVSRIKWCSRVTGRPVDHDTTPPGKRSKWVDSVVAGPLRSHWEQSLALFVQRIENLLLQ